MSKVSQKGISLIELIIASSLGAVVILGLGSVGNSTIRLNASYRLLSALQKDTPIIRKLLDKYFDRATGATFTQKGAAANGYQIREQGAIVIDTDLRDCGSFNPSSSAANLTQVVVTCCDINLALTANTPSGGTVAAKSSCVSNNGLSIEEIKAGVSIKKQCFENIRQMNVAIIGQDDVRQSPLYSIDFFGNSGLLPDKSFNPLFNIRTLIYESNGNTGGLTVDCPKPTLPN